MAVDGDPEHGLDRARPARPVHRDHDRPQPSTTSRCCSRARGWPGVGSARCASGRRSRAVRRRARRAFAAGRPTRHVSGQRRCDHRADLARRHRRRHHGLVDRTPVGIAEADFGIGMSPEVIRTPTDMTAAMRDAGVDAPVTYVLTRRAGRPTNRWRADPEIRMLRDIDVPAARGGRRRRDRPRRPAGGRRHARRLCSASTARRHRYASPACPTAAGWAAADGDDATAWMTPFNHVDGAVLRRRARRCESADVGAATRRELLTRDGAASLAGSGDGRRRARSARRRRPLVVHPPRRVLPPARCASRSWPATSRPPGTAATATRADARGDHRDRQHRAAPTCHPRSTPGAATTSCRSTAWRYPCA